LQKEGRRARQKRQKEALNAEMLGQTPVKQVPRTIENTREDDVTFVQPGDDDIAVEEEQDEFAAHFAHERPPHVLLTTCRKCTGTMYKFCADMMVRRPRGLALRAAGGNPRVRNRNHEIRASLRGMHRDTLCCRVRKFSVGMLLLGGSTFLLDTHICRGGSTLLAAILIASCALR
jgi:hypothetical protein